MGMTPLYGENSGFYAQSSSHLGGRLVSVVRLSVCVCVCVCVHVSYHKNNQNQI